MHFANEIVKPSVEHKFSKQTPQNWVNAALKELDGGELEKLVFENAGLLFKPYNTHADVLLPLISPLPVSAQPFSNPRQWINMPKVLVEDSKEANATALFHLQNGADGIYFEMKDPSAKAKQLLDKIELPYCSVSFLVNEASIDFLQSFVSFAESKFDRSKISGTIFCKNYPGSFDVNQFRGWKSFRASGLIIEQHPDSATEIAEALDDAVNRMEILLGKGWKIEEAAMQISFSVIIGADFFLEAIKLRVLRALWGTILHAYQINSDSPVFIHAISKSEVKANFQPHGNLIKETFSALSAIIGGCDGLTVEPEDEKNTMMNRVARNTSSVLRDESFLSRVSDPLAGSYFVESLSNQLAEKAWKRFQDLTKK